MLAYTSHAKIKAMTLHRLWVPAEETDSAVEDQIAKEATIAEPIKMFHLSGHCYDHSQSATSHMHVSEAPEVSSAPRVQLEEPLFHEDDFLEMNDLIDPEPALPEIEILWRTWSLKMDLSAFDLSHDAEMFLRDMGHVDQETASHPYVNTLESNVVNQHYQSLPLGDNADQSCELRMRHERHIMSPTEHANVSFSSSTSENANRALERVSSFSRVRDNVKQASIDAALLLQAMKM
ncbi:uncharacterized protein LOC129286452 [Prosopis cineraria]|uniref:uncharacterized protein LOC129286452 n=1 Tax=Prosopis cineraria TaxID=364024 RepID=UPI00241025A9|nr:uncharacterized protein LOC129286452 [Prosopis cineraria]